MIPQKLQIKNFLSYGPTLQTIDFTNYSLICLSGKNGHGKSALLDAMTWALWGQARKVSGATKADQGLLRLGQTQMLVVFDFVFGGKTYRVRREYMETYGKPVNTLEFGMIDSDTDTFIPLTDKTIRTTQEKIEQTLRLDFDSFSNSAFLRQGSSNEFSKKSPKDRKQILATILGLDQYEVIRKLALEKTKDAQTKKTVLTTLQEKRTQELTAQAALDAELEHLTEQMRSIEKTEKQLHADQRAHLDERTIYDEQQKQHHNLSFQLQQLNEQITTQKKQLRELLFQWRTVNKKKQSLHSIHQLEQEKSKTIATIVEHQKLFQENLEHRQALLNVTQHITTVEQQYKDKHTKKNHALQLELERLRAEHKNHQQLIMSTEEHIKQHHKEEALVIAHIATHQQELSKITQEPDAIAHEEAHLEKRKAAYQQFVSLGNWINSELNSLSNKKKLVHEDDPSCPLCEQNLSASRRRFLKLNFEKQESFLAHRLRRLKRIIPTLKEVLINQHTHITKNKEIVQHAAVLTSKITELTATHIKIAQQITAHTAICEQQNKDLAEQAKIIAIKQQEAADRNDQTIHIHDQEYRTLIERQQLLIKQLSSHVYREHDYKKDQEQLKLIESQLADYEILQKDVAQQENRKNDVHKLCTSLKQCNAELQNTEKKRSALGDLDAQLQLLQNKEKDLENQHTALKNSKELLSHAQGSIENQQKHLTKIKNEFEKEQTTIALLESIIDDYQTIATATGKDGIQALLIEEAIPEIEQEANYLLSRLTNNQAQIFIESLRDLKKGGTKETLDIKISDQAGIRPYELFSGGEAFRIDFALRIAISKLLARRAGTALQILIIDEGFGSQDEEGLGHIMDALHKIQDDFSKIIIVSHLPSMKDQFPVQFFVEKGVQGSTVSIIEQG
ncbi:MAG TPA: SMC family ATPase [Candidatus Babeliales bacterium]|nr:SMC family ATPase [Candidatus Babeliales bacterium]